jgi:YVTN family beta-propeller protein
MVQVSGFRRRIWTGVTLALILLSFSPRPPLSAGGSDTAVSDDLLMVTNWGDDSVSLINVVSGQVLSTIAVGHKPYDIKIDPTGRFAYVSDSGGSEISVIDIQANLEAYRIPVGTSPRDLELFRSGKRAVVANSGDDTISVLDLEKRKELFTVPVGGIPYGVAMAEGGRVALVTNWGENSLSVVRLTDTSGQVVKTIPLPSLPYTVIVPARGRHALVTNFGAGVITPIALDTYEAREPIAVGKSPWGISSAANFAAIANFYDNHITFVRLSDRQVVLRLDLGTRSGAAVAAARRAKNTASNNSFVAASDLGANEILVIDCKTQQLARTVPVGKAPYGLAFVPRPTAAVAPPPSPANDPLGLFAP